MKMKALIVMLSLCLPIKKALAQGGVVSAPILEAEVASTNAVLAEQSGVMASMNGVVAALESGENKYKEMLKKATWVRNLQTAQRLVTLIENVVCTTRNLNARLSFASNSCLYKFNYDIGIVKISMAADYLAIVMTDGTSMSAGERMTAVNQAITAFEMAQRELVKLNYSLNGRMLLNARVLNSKSTVHQLVATKNYYR